MRAVLDTSVLISALLKGWWREIATAIDAGCLAIVASPDLIDEFLDVVERPRIARFIAESDAAEVADLLRRAELHRPSEIREVCRDASDDYLLALTEIAAADVLVTRDEDLLSLAAHGRTAIIYVAEFLSRLAESRSSRQ
ncbi:MAG: putative toxin-antitoxin system toxin component, PIN family [Phycisphaerales bacterium]|nr:putative toxin-antitoxin system toxin component, PIN family [Phycisphaerales bacterium]